MPGVTCSRHWRRFDLTERLRRPNSAAKSAASADYRIFLLHWGSKASASQNPACDAVAPITGITALDLTDVGSAFPNFLQPHTDSLFAIEALGFFVAIVESLAVVLIVLVVSFLIPSCDSQMRFVDLLMTETKKNKKGVRG